MDGLAASPLPVTPSMAFTDVAGLNDLRHRGPEALQQVAAQFESLFVGIWLKSMRDAGKVFGEGSYLSSDTVEMHQEMLDQQLSIHLAESGGVGLRDVIVAQLSGGRADPPAAMTADGAVSFDRNVPPRWFFATHAGDVDQPEAGASGSAEVTSDGSVTAAAAEVHAGGFKQALFDSAEAFVRELRPVVERVAALAGIHPVAVLAQAALETGWGARVIHDADGAPSHNLFGIKATGWGGPTAEVTTLEFEFGGFVRRADRFRAYPDFAASVQDYVGFLQSGDRYADALAVGDRPEAFADALQRAGYATDPGYAAKLKAVQQQIQRMLTGT